MGNNLLSFHYSIDIYPLTGNTKFVTQGLSSYSVLFLAFINNLDRCIYLKFNKIIYFQ